jgi:predicted permease
MEFPLDSGLWAPMRFAQLERQRGSNFIFVAARLHAGVDRATAQDRVSGLAARLAAEYPAEHSGLSLRVIGVQERLVANMRGSLWMLTLAVSLVLLTVCANVATLLSGRMLARQRELATRFALGASPRRLALQTIGESLLLSCVGGAAGIALAAGALVSLVALRPPGLLHVDSVALDLRVLAFAIGATLVTAALSGSLPAMYALRHSGAYALQTVQRSVMHAGGAHRWMVVSQLGLSMALLVGVGSLLATIARLERVDAGFDTDALLTAMIALPAPTPANFNDPDAVAAQQRRNTPFLAALHERVGALPGVAGVGVIDALPLSGTNNLNGAIEVADRTFAPGGAPTVEFRWVTPSYFSAAGIPLLSGTTFTTSGDESPQDDSVLINSALAESLWPNESAIGKRIGAMGRSFTVVGVAGNVRQWSLDRDPSPEMYFSYDSVVAPSTAAIVVRANVEPAALTELVRRAIVGIDADVPVFDMRTMAQVTSAGNARRTFALTLLAAFAGIAALVTATGVYGVTAHAVARRTREIGVRLALGADHRKVLSDFVRDGMTTALIGISIGTALGMLFARLLRGLVWGVENSEPFIYLAAASLLGTLAFAATLIPARRAGRIDSIEALRHE